jgi:hypothetical protein
MSEAEYKRAQEYILEATLFSNREQPYALAWLAYIYVYPNKPDGKRPLPASFGMKDDWGNDIADAVETLVIDLRNPHFDRDDPALL